MIKTKLSNKWNRVIKNINSTLPSIQKIGLRLHDGFETQSFFKTWQIFKGITNRSFKSDHRATLAQNILPPNTKFKIASLS